MGTKISLVFIVFICALIFPLGIVQGASKDLTSEEGRSLEEEFRKYKDDPARKKEMNAQRANSAKAYTDKANRENFADWRGILIYCYHTKQEADQTLNKICERSYTNANFLAASSKINLETAESLEQVGFESRVGDRLILMIELSATRSPAAVGVSLKAYTGYSGPVEKLDESQDKVQWRTNRRSGDLIFWERGAIGASSGVGYDLVSPLSEAIDGMLKQFFADYLNAQKR